MSMTLNLEIASGVGLEDIKATLECVTCSDMSESENGLTAMLPDKNVSMTVKTNLEDNTVLTEDIEGAEWKVGVRVYFYIDATLAKSLDDVRKFIVNLSEQTPFSFALSFQYETIYAKKDQDGLVLSEEFLVE